MKKNFKFNPDFFRKLLGKKIHSLGISNGIYNAFQNEFDNIEIASIWLTDNDKEHFAISLKAQENGRIIDKVDEEVNETYFGVVSLKIGLNDYLKFSKNGSIKFRPDLQFFIDGYREPIQKISLFQEIRSDLLKTKKGELQLVLKQDFLFPDKVVIETHEMYLAIMGYENDDQDLLLRIKVGFLNNNDPFYKSNFSNDDLFESILIESYFL
jgi:hypothetical protein